MNQTSVSPVVSSRRHEKVKGHKSPVFALLPPALLACVCLGAAAQRVVVSYRNHQGGGAAGDAVRFGEISGGDARRLADALCTEVTGEPSESLDASHQSVYSKRRGATVREWNVLCNTPAALYLVRINANTGRVYAINRMEEGGLDASVALARLQGDDKSSASPPIAETCCAEPDHTSPTDTASYLKKPAAEAQARRYLQFAGIASKWLHPLYGSPSCSIAGATQWNFTYRRRVPGLGSRLIKVSVDGKSGQLTHMWKPAMAM